MFLNEVRFALSFLVNIVAEVANPRRAMASMVGGAEEETGLEAGDRLATETAEHSCFRLSLSARCQRLFIDLPI